MIDLLVINFSLTIWTSKNLFYFYYCWNWSRKVTVPFKMQKTPKQKFVVNVLLSKCSYFFKNILFLFQQFSYYIPFTRYSQFRKHKGSYHNFILFAHILQYIHIFWSIFYLILETENTTKRMIFLNALKPRK